ncbi:MAG: type II toxin-antitoxin system PemK/MazF family toxin [Erysipelotrichaceae bacterium]|nr:type II toxin-antitoxin system PemK/MazF family toxin [Erysipelotrichaceae bacterium]
MVDEIKRGDIFIADLEPSFGYEQCGVRPVLIIQNDKGNLYSQTTIVACISSRVKSKARLPTHVYIKARHALNCNSIVLLEQIRVIDKDRLLSKIGILDDDEMNKVDSCLKISLDLN